MDPVPGVLYFEPLTKIWCRSRGEVNFNASIRPEPPAVEKVQGAVKRSSMTSLQLVPSEEYQKCVPSYVNTIDLGVAWRTSEINLDMDAVVMTFNKLVLTLKQLRGWEGRLPRVRLSTTETALRGRICDAETVSVSLIGLTRALPRLFLWYSCRVAHSTGKISSARSCCDSGSWRCRWRWP